MDTTTVPSFGADGFGSRGRINKQQNKQRTMHVLVLHVTLHGVGSVPELLAKLIKIRPRKDGVRPLSCKEEHEKVDRGTARSWKVIWETCCHMVSPVSNCDHCRTPISTGSYFEVLIDLGYMADVSSIMRPGQKNVLQTMEKLLVDQDLADVTFQFTGGTELKAHSIVLAAGSPVLAAMLSHDMKESSSRVVEIEEDTSAEVFQQVLEYLYTGKAKDMEEMAEELLEAADKYQIDSLKEECASLLQENLTVDNAVKVLVLSHLHSCHDLHQFTLSFLADKGKVVGLQPDWLECMKNYPELCFQANARMLLGK